MQYIIKKPENSGFKLSRGSKINFVDPDGEGFKPKSLFRCAQRYFSVFSLQFANPFAFRSKTEKPCTFGARLFGLSG